jgi:hypothetical protein
MKRSWTLIVVFLLVAAAANLAVGEGNEPKPGPLTGTWECVAHSSGQGDVPSTLKLEQIKEAVSGILINSSGDYPLSSASYKKAVFEFHLDAPDGNYVATGKLMHGQLSGHWSKGQEAEGEWECRRPAPAKP